MILGASLSFLFAHADAFIDVSVRIVEYLDVDVIAIPEKRIPSTGNNTTLLDIEVREHASTTPFYTTSVVTASGGTATGVTLATSNGVYDVTGKGFSHLRRKLSNVTLSGDVTLDFSYGGASPLLCGDVNSTDGDNKVNGIDLTLIVEGLNGHSKRLDLNQDTKVNGIDLTNAVSNLNVTGDE